MKRPTGELLLASPSPANRDDRGVRADSVTNQLRALVKPKQRKRRTLTLEPLEHRAQPGTASPNHGEVREQVSVQKQIQGPVSLQWLIDDFVQAAGVGDVTKVDHYIRGGIPIDMKHSVLQQTALHASAALRDDEVTRHLVQAGADADALTKDRESALHLAARYHSVAVAKEVLRNDADMRVLNDNDMLAADVAVEIQDEVMEHLLEPPPDPPSDVRATTISSTSITIAWSSHSQISSNYQFRVSWVLSGSLGDVFEVCSSTSFRINNLMPAASYEVRVQTGNHTVGWSASSHVLRVDTDGDIPRAMAAPIILRVSDHSITMRIRLPPNNGADIQRVSIQAQCTGSIGAISTDSFRKLLRSADQDQRWESVVCEVSFMRNAEDNPHDKEHSMEGLLPGHVYYFRVKASNHFGWSPDGEVSDGICTNDVPKVVSTTSRSMILVWTKPYSTQLIDMYQVQARASYSTKWDVVAENVQGQRADINELVPATSYSFRVIPHYASSATWENPDTCTFTELCTTHTTVPELPKNFQAVDRTAHCIMLSWETPRCNGHAVEAYKVEYRIATSCDWYLAGADVPVYAKTFTVPGLTRGQPYQFRVCARNARGEGLYAQVLDPPVWTYAFLPPTAPTCVAKTSFSLSIVWQDGISTNDTGDPPSESNRFQYEVQIRQIDSSVVHSPHVTEIINTTDEWLTVLDACADRVAVISGLSPLGYYCFRVRARAQSPTKSPESNVLLGTKSSTDHASSVFSPISDVFQTLRRM